MNKKQHTKLASHYKTRWHTANITGQFSPDAPIRQEEDYYAMWAKGNEHEKLAAQKSSDKKPV